MAEKTSPHPDLTAAERADLVGDLRLESTRVAIHTGRTRVLFNRAASALDAADQRVRELVELVLDARALLREYVPGRFPTWHARADAVRNLLPIGERKGT